MKVAQNKALQSEGVVFVIFHATEKMEMREQKKGEELQEELGFSGP